MALKKIILMAIIVYFVKVSAMLIGDFREGVNLEV